MAISTGNFRQFMSASIFFRASKQIIICVKYDDLNRKSRRKFDRYDKTFDSPAFALATVRVHFRLNIPNGVLSEI